MKFSKITGHENLKYSLSKYGEGHFLFFGPPCGKRSVAFEIAKYVLCSGTKEDDCFCRSCNIFSQGHPDFLCVGRNGKILVEDIGNVIEFVSRAPLISSTKVIVIDNAENISIEAANRILKLLEESSYTFFLTTPDLNQILPTIRSRCIKIKFNALSQEDVTSILWQKMGFELSQARILGWIGSGSAVNIFSHAGQYLKCRNSAVDLVAQFTSKDFLGVLESINKIEKEEMPFFLEMLILVLTDILLMKKTVDAQVSSDRKDILQKAIDQLDEKAILVLINILVQTKGYVKLNVNLYMFIKTALMRVWPVLQIPKKEVSCESKNSVTER